MSNKTTDSIRFSVPQRGPVDRKKKLGKGLGALLVETKREEPLVSSGGTGSENAGMESGQPVGASDSGVSPNPSQLQSLPIAAIEPLPGNPRKHFDETAIEELAASIAARGVIQPIIVRPQGKGRYQLVAGERRWRAAQKGNFMRFLRLFARLMTVR